MNVGDESQFNVGDKPRRYRFRFPPIPLFPVASHFMCGVSRFAGDGTAMGLAVKVYEAFKDDEKKAKVSLR